MIRRLIKEEEAQSLSEYVLVIFALVLIGWSIINVFKEALKGYFNKFVRRRSGYSGMRP